jgi:DNA adenine methylase
VLLNREPSGVETYNDLDGDVVNFFRVLRDRCEELTRAVSLTPYSRADFIRAIEEPSDNSIERARQFYVRALQARAGLSQRTATTGHWGFSSATARRGVSLHISRWIGHIEGLPELAARLLTVQIECRPAIELVPIYDHPETLFYCDPPYVRSTRSQGDVYHAEMTDEDHRELAGVLRAARGRVAVSGYRCDLMDELYGDWRRYDAPAMRAAPANGPRSYRHECVWMNYREEFRLGY